ncbi:MAG: hypothetical protein ACRD47_06795 [Nitrososphaeraceae archaeon]|jgi:hypothetical protein
MSNQIKTEFLRTSTSDTLLISNLAAPLSKAFDFPEMFRFPPIDSGILKWANLELEKRRLKKRSDK